MKSSTNKTIFWLRICLIAAVLLNGFFIVSQLGDFPLLEEVHFVEAARAISKTGMPFYGFWYHAGNAGNVELGWEYTLWHPPLYQYISALAIRLFQPDWVAMRMAHYIFFIGVLLLLFYLFRSAKLCEPAEIPLKQRDWAAMVVLCLTLINPWTIQSVLLIDIDNNVLFFLVTLFLFCFVLRAGKTDNLTSWLLGLLFCFTLWVKLTTPFALPILIFFYYLPTLGTKKSFFFVLKFLLIGIGLFLLSYSMFALLTGLEFSQPFQQPLNRVLGAFNLKGPTVSLLTKISAIVKEGVLIIIWLTPATFMLFVIGIYERGSRIFKVKKLQPIDLLAGFGLIVFVGYLLIMAVPFDFPKYQGMMIPFLLIPVAPLIVSAGKKLYENITRKDIHLYAIIFFLVLFYSYTVVKDPIYALYADVFSQHLLKRCLNIALFILPLPVVLILLKINNSKLRTKELLTITALLVLVPSNLSIAFYQIRADYSTNYFYGEKGMQDVTAFIRANYNNGQLIFARKDVGWASGAKWIQVDDYLTEGHPSGVEEFKRLLHSLRPSMVVISYRRSRIRKRVYLQKIADEILNPSGYNLANKIGDFEIYKIE